MGHPAGTVRLALDHNFPAPVLKAFGVMMPNVALVPIAEVDPALAEVDDWELFVALHRREPRWDGLVTNDEALLSLPREMTVLPQTRLTLVVAAGEGHNPIRAVGLLLCHLNHICHHTTPDRSQVWKLTVFAEGLRLAAQVSREDRREEEADRGAADPDAPTARARPPQGRD